MSFIETIKRVFVRGPVFEVIKNAEDRWYYHERYAGDIKNVSQAYASKANAVRAARRKAADTKNATWKVL